MSKSKKTPETPKTAAQSKAAPKVRSKTDHPEAKGRVLTPADLKTRSAKPKTVKPKPPSQSEAVPAIPSSPNGAKTEAPKLKRGRPSKCTPELMDEIVLRMSHGEPLRQICRDHDIHFSIVYDWQQSDEEFSRRIAHARELGEEAIAQQCLEIADDDTRDWEVVRDKDGAVTGVKVDGEHVQRSKLRIETRLKLLAKWNPRKWGEKVDLNHGGQPDNPLGSLIQRVAGSGLPIKGHSE